MPETERRKRTLTDADIEAIKELSHCQMCAFNAEEVQFVKNWLQTAKEAKSEFVKWIVRSLIVAFGIACGIATAAKMGWFKG